MNLDDAQRKVVTRWVSEGMKLSDIQTKLASELGVKLTYMEVRLLVDDLKLVPKDIEPPKRTVLGGKEAAESKVVSGTAEDHREESSFEGEDTGSVGTASVSVAVDQLARPGAIVSGKVKFSDGQTGEWHLDQSGRLGFVPPSPGYRPSASDLQQFQTALSKELGKLGF